MKLTVLRGVLCIMLFVALLGFTSCNKVPSPPLDEGTEEPNNYFVGEVVSRLDNSTVRFAMDYRKFFSDNTVFSRDIALASLLFYTSTDMHLIGLENVSRRNVGLEDNDRTGLLMGHRRVVYNGDVREIIFVQINGYTQSWMAFEEWFSNLDVGADTPAYFYLTGSDHPEWTNRLNFKGFDVTAGRIIAEIKGYMNHFVSDAQPVLWITGFSRGGALSNIVGAYFERQTDIITFVYPFASPGVTTSGTAHDYQTIFNIINEDDMTALFPPPSWGFVRFGVDLSTSVATYGKENFLEIMGTEYIYYADALSMVYRLGEHFPNREALFVFDDDIFFASDDFPTRAAAEDEKHRLVSLLQPELRQFVSFYIREIAESGGYRVVVYQTPAFVLKSLAYVVAGGKPDNLHLAEQFARIFADVAPAYILSGLGHPHFRTAYYIVVGLVDG